MLPSHQRRKTLAEQAEGVIPLYVERKIYAKYPGTDLELIQFLRFARRSRLPKTRHLIQEKAKTPNGTLGIADFSASSGYMEKFLKTQQDARFCTAT